MPVQLLLNNEFYGERVTTVRREDREEHPVLRQALNVGVDIYNVFNSDAITSYNDNLHADNPATPAVNENNWLQPMGLVSPRFVRLQVQFEF